MISLAPEERPHVFRSPASSLGSLDPEVANTLITAADIAIAMDPDGVIVDIAFGDDQSLPIQDVQVDRQTLDRNRHGGEQGQDPRDPHRRRWPTHPMAAGQSSDSGAPDLPVRYSAMRLDASGRMIAVGRSLQAVAVSSAPSSQRPAIDGTGLFPLASGRGPLPSAVPSRRRGRFGSRLATLRVVEANPAANRLFASGSGHVVDRDFVELVDEKGRAEVQSQFALVRVGGQPEEIRVRLAAPADGSGPWSAGRKCGSRRRCSARTA